MFCTFSNENEIKGVSEIFTLPEYLSKYLEYLDFQAGLSNHTLRAYSTDVLQVFQLENEIKMFGPKLDKSTEYSWSHINSSNISMSYDDWKQLALAKLRSWDNLSPKSRKRKISSLNGFTNWLKVFQKIDLDIHVEAPSGVHRKLPHFISVDESLSILNHLKRATPTPVLEHQKHLFYLLYGCGLRVSEACNVRWADFKFQKRQIRILGKGKKERLAILPEAINVYFQNKEHNSIFVFGDKPLPTRTAYKRVKDLGKAANLIQPIHPHALRHSYATHLLSSGSDLRVLQQLLGHQSLAATELYTHLDMDHLATAMENHHPLSKK